MIALVVSLVTLQLFEEINSSKLLQIKLVFVFLNYPVII